MQHPLVKWRMDTKQTQRSAAEAMDVSIYTWQKYEGGVTVMLNPERAARLYKLTGVTCAQLEKARERFQEQLQRAL
jgi:transcriptional regulator with XRE-family HTH domain